MPNKTSKTYRVRKTPEGNKQAPLSGIRWNLAEKLSDFSFPWEKEKTPRMEFRALHDMEWLYLYFCVVDQKVKTYVNTNEKAEVIYGDRVEIFFTTDPELTSYYCLEIDPLGRVYDYHASHYRKFDAAWQWPIDHCFIDTKMDADGYEVAVAISMKSLKDLKLVNDRKLRTGIFRGKCTEIDLQKDNMRWISWVAPDSPFPDFHIPSSFGTLMLE